MTGYPGTVDNERQRDPVSRLEFCGCLEEFPMFLAHSRTYIWNSITIQVSTLATASTPTWGALFTQGLRAA
jgi:hypothetical protein